MLYYNNAAAAKVKAFLTRLEEVADTLGSRAVYLLVVIHAIKTQRCLGRDCGTCGGGACVDSPEVHLRWWPKVDEMYRKEKYNGARPINASSGEVFEHYFMVKSIRREMEGFGTSLEYIREIYPDATTAQFSTALEQMRWEDHREHLWY